MLIYIYSCLPTVSLYTQLLSLPLLNKLSKTGYWLRRGGCATLNSEVERTEQLMTRYVGHLSWTRQEKATRFAMRARTRPSRRRRQASHGCPAGDEEELEHWQGTKVGRRRTRTLAHQVVRIVFSSLSPSPHRLAQDQLDVSDTRDTCNGLALHWRGASTTAPA